MNVSVMSTSSDVCHPWQIVVVLKASQQEQCIAQFKKNQQDFHETAKAF